MARRFPSGPKIPEEAVLRRQLQGHKKKCKISQAEARECRRLVRIINRLWQMRKRAKLNAVLSSLSRKGLRQHRSIQRGTQCLLVRGKRTGEPEQRSVAAAAFCKARIAARRPEVVAEEVAWTTRFELETQAEYQHDKVDVGSAGFLAVLGDCASGTASGGDGVLYEVKKHIPATLALRVARHLRGYLSGRGLVDRPESWTDIFFTGARNEVGAELSADHRWLALLVGQLKMNLRVPVTHMRKALHSIPWIIVPTVGLTLGMLTALICLTLRSFFDCAEVGPPPRPRYPRHSAVLRFYGLGHLPGTVS